MFIKRIRGNEKKFVFYFSKNICFATALKRWGKIVEEKLSHFKSVAKYLAFEHPYQRVERHTTETPLYKMKKTFRGFVSDVHTL